MEALAKKMRTRGGHKASSTKTMWQIDKLLAIGNPDKVRLTAHTLLFKQPAKSYNRVKIV